MTLRQAAILTAGVVAISWAAPFIRLAGDVPSIVIAALRLSIAAPPMIGLAVALEGARGLRRLSLGDLALLALAGLALAGHFAFWVASVQRTSVATSVVLVTMNPLFVALGAWLFLRERPSRAVVLGIVAGGLGALLLAADDLGDRGTTVGNALALLGALMASIYLVVGRAARRHLSTTTYTAVVYSVTAVVLMAVALGSGTPLRGYAPEAYVYMALLALVPQLIGHNALNFSLGALPAATVAVAILAEPVGSAAIAAVWLDEIPTVLECVGGAVILAGVYVAIRGSRTTAQVPTAVEA